MCEINYVDDDSSYKSQGVSLGMNCAGISNDTRMAGKETENLKLLHCHREEKIARAACLALAMQYLLKSCRHIENS